MRFIDESILSGKGIEMIGYCGCRWKVWIDERYIGKNPKPYIVGFICQEDVKDPIVWYMPIEMDENWQKAIVLNINFALAAIFWEYLDNETNHRRL